MARRLFITAFALFACWLAECGKKTPTPLPAKTNDPVLKIAVFADGRLMADGSVTTLPKLRETLSELRKKKGVVWYYRESAQQEPPAIAMEVLQAVVERGLPIRLSTRPDYSDAIGPGGKTVTP